MPKIDMIEVEGIVREAYPQMKFLVDCTFGENHSNVVCTLSGKLRVNYIRVLPGDSVKVEISPYDLTRGRITWRYK